MRRILVGLIAMAIGCTGNEALQPIEPAVKQPSNPIQVLPGVWATYVMVLVDNQPLPVKSPFGAGDWDYDSDVGTWQLIAATLTLEPSGVFTENVTHRAASGSMSSQAFVGKYTRKSSTLFEFSDDGPTYKGEISGDRLVMTFSNGGTFTFEH
ncbi:MAG: hypothetical protein ABIZ36_04605 [Gemmatimonadaceae bacterium]